MKKVMIGITLLTTLLFFIGCASDLAYNNWAAGKNALKKGNYDTAISNFQAAVDLMPEDASYYYWLGVAFHKKAQYKEAIESFEKARELGLNQEQYAHATSSLADSYLKTSQYEKAVDLYKEAIKRKPTESHLFNELAYCQSELGNYDDAITAAKRAIELDPDNSSAHHNLGYAYGEKKQYDEAIKAYKKSIELDPADAVHYANIAWLFLEKGDYREAENYLKKAVELVPKNRTYPMWLSSAYYKQGRYEDAVEVVNKAISHATCIIGIGSRIQIVDSYPAIYSVLASGPAERAGAKKGDTILKIDGKSTKGWKLEDVVTNLRGREGTKVTLTIKRGEKGKPFEISVTRQKIIPKEASTAFAYRSLIERHMGNKVEAVKDAEQAYSLDSSDGWARLALGAARLDQGRYDEAVGLLSEVEDNTEARIFEATAYAKKGDLQKAIGIYTSIEEKLSPKDVPFWSGRAELLEELKPYAAARRENASRLRAQGRYREALMELGQAMRVADGAGLEAICREIAQMIAMDPGLTAVPEEARKYALRGDVLTGEGEFEEAVEEYRKAVEEAPYVAKLYLNTAMLYGEMKKYPQAIEHMKTYLLLAPEAPNIRAAKDQIYKWEFMMEKGE